VFFLIFEIGSTLSGAATSLDMFIVGRTTAGIGCADLFTGIMTSWSMCFPCISDRPFYEPSCLGQPGNAGSPLIGSVFTSNIYTIWRWCFYLNLCLFPIIAIAFLLNTIPEAEMKP
jgi:MFS family permease